MEIVLKYIQPALKTFDLHIGNFTISPNYLQAGAIVFLLFLLLLSLARLRKMYTTWSLSGWHAFFFMGFLLAIILEGFFIIGGKTIFTQLIGWENTPKPIKVALEAGRGRLVDVLGVQTEVPTSYASSEPTDIEVYNLYQRLPDSEKEEAWKQICSPE